MQNRPTAYFYRLNPLMVGQTPFSHPYTPLFLKVNPHISRQYDACMFKLLPIFECHRIVNKIYSPKKNGYEENSSIGNDCPFHDELCNDSSKQE